ncbi:unnamed protein product (macronuclear) [Paramecium tetraurelia]|uniref:Tetratricopeptide repeat protein n=1 Tax=Paramecium tetraurelia TaxID=5888 RepID=A0CZG6_PARTE|nr:uncharacterized protein GSPATT00011756001 [Paramecium tetraurelia]CAK76183.1 unnamed protein product [Paramecium tetraurelia]|eukprot:XP_001443580.1 hypothetical protein (macronuclear) [Paramecium tetraurelia strain d4-2]
MIQQQKSNQHCKLHPNESVIFCCFKQECNQNRIFCLDCLKQKQHIEHMDAVQKLEDANIFINQQLSKIKEVITATKNEFDLAKESFNTLIIGLQYQVFGLEAVMNNMNLNEIQETIANLFLFERVKSTMQQSIDQTLYKLRKTIEDTYQNFQLNLFIQKDEEILVKIGSYLFEQQQYRKAIEYYDECLNMNVENEQALFGKGECLRAIQQFKQASECYQKVQFINNNNAQAYIKQGQKQFNFQENVYDICINLIQQLRYIIKPYFWINLILHQFIIRVICYCLLQLWNFTEAKECFEEVVKINSDNNYTLLAKSNLLLLTLHPEEAKQILDQILENSPQKFDIFLLNTSISTFTIREFCDFHQDTNEVEQMIQQFPQNIFALYLKGIKSIYFQGISLIKDNNIEEAQKIQEKLIEIDPTSWMIKHLKGVFELIFSEVFKK